MCACCAVISALTASDDTLFSFVFCDARARFMRISSHTNILGNEKLQCAVQGLSAAGSREILRVPLPPPASSSLLQDPLFQRVDALTSLALGLWAFGFRVQHLQQISRSMVLRVVKLGRISL